jgi:urease beta subunit
MWQKIIKLLVVVYVCTAWSDATVGKIIINGVEIGNSTNKSVNSESVVYGSGKIEHISRKLNYFENLNINGGFAVRFEFSNKLEIEIIADDNIIPVIVTKVNNNTLSVFPDKPISSRSPIQLIIKSPALNDINLLGTTSASFHRIQTPSLKLTISGTGEVFIDGKVANLTTATEGTGTLNLKNLSVNNASININGTGNVIITVQNHLDVNITGVGDVIYYGKPAITRTVVGVGNIVAGD